MESKTNLVEIYSRFSQPDKGGDKGTQHSYIDIYSELMKSSGSILEVGVYQGHSLAMFQEYFQGEVLGLDITLRHLKFECNAVECDATAKDQVNKALAGKKFSYILDDGSHRLADQLTTLQLLWPYLKKGGLFFIEDIQSPDAAKILVEAVEKLTDDFELHDLRHRKNRYDDILLVAKKVN